MTWLRRRITFGLLSVICGLVYLINGNVEIYKHVDCYPGCECHKIQHEPYTQYIQICKDQYLSHLPSGPSKTTELDLSHNRIHLTSQVCQDVRDANYEGLRVLYLNDNNLANAEEGCFRGTRIGDSLEELSLENNNWSSPDALIGLVRDLLNLVKLNLKGNPDLDCSPVRLAFPQMMIMCDDRVHPSTSLNHPHSNGEVTTTAKREDIADNVSSATQKLPATPPATPPATTPPTTPAQVEKTSAGDPWIIYVVVVVVIILLVLIRIVINAYNKRRRSHTMVIPHFTSSNSRLLNVVAGE